MMKCFFWMTAICVAPLVWLMIEATVKRPFEAYFEGLISRIELIPLHRLNFEDQFSRRTPELFPSRMTHCHGSASPYDWALGGWIATLRLRFRRKSAGYRNSIEMGAFRIDLRRRNNVIAFSAVASDQNHLWDALRSIPMTMRNVIATDLAA